MKLYLPLAFLVGIINITQTNGQGTLVKDTFNSSTIWVCPPGVTSVNVKCWGGGGAGGSSFLKTAGGGSSWTLTSGGGGGGAFASGTITVVPGKSYILHVAKTIEALGTDEITKDSTNKLRANGEPSYFESIYANGGQGGAYTCYIQQNGSILIVTEGFGGNGGASTSGSGSYTGGNGATGGREGTDDYGGAGGGSASINRNGNNATAADGVLAVPGGGGGGNGAIVNSDTHASRQDAPGEAPGGGGGGACFPHGSYVIDGENRLGGDGAAGRIILEYSISIRFVKQAATGTGSGNSWQNASSDLQAMIDASEPGSEVWVAGGTYRPIRRADATNIITFNDRNNAFVLKSGVRIYGSFAGTENTPEQRNLTVTTQNASILSGDLKGNDAGFANNGENAYHVVVSAGDMGNATLDGFAIRGGNASSGDRIMVNGREVIADRGSGINCQSASPTLANLVVIENAASYGAIGNFGRSLPNMSNVAITGNKSGNGGGMFNSGFSSPHLTACYITNNTAQNGGGLYSETGSEPVLTGCTISSNKAMGDGGGIYCSSTSVTLTGCTISNDTALINGGAIYTNGGSPILSKCIVSSNGAYYGGAIYHVNGGKLSITGNVFQNNTALAGGAIRMLNGDPSITAIGNTFYANKSYGNDAGALSLVMGNGKDTLANNLFIRNSAFGDGNNGGGAIVQEAGTSTLIVNNTFYADTAASNGGAIFFKSGGSDRNVYNNIFYKSYNGSANTDISLEGGTDITSQGNNLYGAINPLFINEADLPGADKLFGTTDDGLRLQACSPAINAGNNAALPTNITTDITGNARFYKSGIVDMGAFAFAGTDPGAATITGNARVCAGSTGNIASVRDAGEGAVYKWTIDNGTLTSPDNARNIEYAANSTGIVLLSVDVSNSKDCSAASGSFSVAIGAPFASVTAATAVCGNSTGNLAAVSDAGAGAKYAWTITNGSITSASTVRSITYTAGSAGSVVLNVLVTGAGNCSTSSGDVPVVVHALPSAIISTANSVCSLSTNNVATVPDAGAGATYKWGITNGTITSANDGLTITYTAGISGNVILTVSVTNSNNCTASSGNVAVAVNSNHPSVGIEVTAGSLTGCADAAITFTATPINGGTPNFRWLKNGLYVASGDTYTASNWQTNDIVRCIMKSSLPCSQPDSVVSSGLVVTPDNTAANSWTLITPRALDTRASIGFSIGNKGYIGTSGQFWEYDPTLKLWTEKSKMPGSGIAAFSIGGKGYVISGTEKNFWEYDPDLNKWTQKASCPDNSGAAFSVGSKGYVAIAGNDFWEYDPALDKWVQKASRSGDGSFSKGLGFGIGNKGYLWSNSQGSFSQYDPILNKWTERAKINEVERLNPAGFSIGGKGYIGTGSDGNELKDFWEYDPALDAWKQKADFAGSARSGAVGFSIGNKGYVGYGPANDIYQYSPTSTSISTGVVSSPSCAGSVITVPYVIGCAEFADSNIFTVQISDAFGSFSNPVAIGNVVSTQARPVKATLPNVPGGKYFIRVVGSNPATIGSIANIVINPAPVVGIKISPEATVCKETLVTLSGTGAPFYRWSGGIIDATPFAANTTTTYTVTGTALNGCENTDTVTITVNNPTLAINKDTASINMQGGKEQLVADGGNCRILTEIMPNGANPVAGNLVAKVWVDSSVQSYTYLGVPFPYVQRHYDIAPAENAVSATAQLKLYYSQAEFDAYNVKVGNPLLSLPTGPNDLSGKARLGVYQIHGKSKDGLGKPESYTGVLSVIDPGISNVVWNAALRRWEVSFNVNGFSGFFVGVNLLGTLPVKLVSFTGTLSAGNTAANLQWEVASQQGIQKYSVEKSTDGYSFQSIGTVTANQSASSTYTYTDHLSPASTMPTAYYRIKIMDIDGKTSYSQIVRLNLESLSASKITLHPNPVEKGSWLQISISNGMLRSYRLSTVAGQVLLQKDGLRAIGATSMQMPVGLAAGVYYLQLQTDKGTSNERIIVK